MMQRPATMSAQPVTIEAMVFDGTWESARPILEWIEQHKPMEQSGPRWTGNGGGVIILNTDDGEAYVSPGDCVVRQGGGVFVVWKGILAITPDLIEQLAAAEHASWARWMEYEFGLCTKNLDGSLTIPALKVQHWQRQIDTPYACLSEREKESDRKEVRKILPIIAQAYGPPRVPSGARRFHLQRDHDATGVSGTGRVAEGCAFSTGRVVMAWLTETRSTVMYDSIGDVERIHGHGGMTRVVWDD